MIVPLNISKPIYIAKPPFSLNVNLDDLKIFSGCLNSDQVYNDYDPGIWKLTSFYKFTTVVVLNPNMFFFFKQY